MSALFLRFPEFNRPFLIRTDACGIGLGAALVQKDDDARDAVITDAS